MATTTSPEKSPQVIATEQQYLTSWKLVLVTISLCFGMFLVALDVNIIGVAIPKITSQFDSLNDIGWYGSAYLLAITAFQPAFGNLYKFFNIKAIYLASVALFEVGSILCAACANSHTFIVGRAIAGLGAAGIFQGALAIIGQSVELSKIPLYFGIVVSVFGVSVCIGPIVGGLFTDHVTWRWCFWINVPIGAVVLILIMLILHLRERDGANQALTLKEKIECLDIAGLVVFVGSICCVLLALQWAGQTLPWNSGRIIGLFIGFGLMLLLFGFIQWKRGEKAMIPPRIIRQRSILNGSCFLFFLGMATFAYNFYIPLFFQVVQGTSATESGVRFIAFVIPQISLVAIIGALVTKFGAYVPYMILGSVIATVGAGLISMFDTNISTVKWASYLVISGLGIGICMQLPYTAVQVVLSGDDIPIGNGISIFAWQLGGALSLAICQTLLVGALKAKVSIEIPSIPTEAVISSGAGNIASLTNDSMILLKLRSLYSDGIHRALILALITAALSVPFACMMESLNVKEVNAQRRDCVTNEHEVDA